MRSWGQGPKETCSPPWRVPGLPEDFFDEHIDFFVDSEIFHDIGLHKPDFDDNLYDHIYVTRRITAPYSRKCVFEKD